MTTAYSWNCPICDTPHFGQVEYELSHPNHPLVIYRCSCDLMYSNYALAHAPDDIYEDGFYHHVRYTDKSGRAAYLKHLSAHMDAAGKVVSKPGRGRKTLLDIGCATGDFVQQAIKQGWDAEGIDVSGAAVDEGKKRGLPLTKASVHEISGLGRTFDMVTMWDVLEHLDDPLTALTDVRAVLKDGGTLLVKTISSRSMLDRIARSLYLISGKRIQAPLKKFYVPGHLYYFTEENLRILLQHAGLHVAYFEYSDTPSKALFKHPLARVAFDAASAMQQMTGTCYEFAVGCTIEQKPEPTTTTREIL